MIHTSKYYIALLAIIVGPSAVFSADRIEIPGVDQEQAASMKDFLQSGLPGVQRPMLILFCIRRQGQVLNAANGLREAAISMHYTIK